GLALVLATGVVGLYIYYPAPGDLLDEMDGVHVELMLALKSEPVSREKTIRLAEQWRRLERKLAVADLLRRGWFDARLKASSDELRVAINQLREGLVEGASTEQAGLLCSTAHPAVLRSRDLLAPKTAHYSPPSS